MGLRRRETEPECQYRRYYMRGCPIILENTSAKKGYQYRRYYLHGYSIV
jgi:hypothetical protein